MCGRIVVVLSIADAREAVLAAVRPLPSEDVVLADALGRVLAEDVRSDGDLPPFDSSAMDGFAVVAGPAADLEIVGESRAGRPATMALSCGEAIRISTGAAVPAGGGAVGAIEGGEGEGGGGRGAGASGGADAPGAR